MTIDPKNIRTGDRIAVMVEVVEIVDDFINAFPAFAVSAIDRPAEGHRTIIVYPARIVSHEPSAPGEGDRVCLILNETTRVGDGELIKIRNGDAFVDWGVNSQLSARYPLDRLERI